MTRQWIRVCGVADVLPDQMVACEANGDLIAVYLVEGRYYATDNVCPHAVALLSDGWLDGLVVECSLHGAQFNVATGELLRGPAACGIRAYPVRVEMNDILCLV